MRALIYTRVSEDRAGGRSTKEQEAECRATCEREGWEVVEVITDSVGASRHSKGKRHGWERVREKLAAGHFDVLVTWEGSRAGRDLGMFLDLRELCSSTGVLWSYSGRIHDLSSGTDRFNTALDALISEREAEETRVRVLRALRSNAASGRPHGRRLFGYRRVYDPTSGRLSGQVPEPAEAAIVVRVFDDLLSGLGVRTIASRLNAEGFRTRSGAEWVDQTVHRIITNPAYAARRVHQGRVTGPAAWPPIVSDDVFDSAQALLEARRTGKVITNRKMRLLTGVARCSRCGGRMAVGHDRKQRKVYQCRSGFCVSRDEVMLDAYIEELIITRLSQPDVAESLSEQPEAEDVRAARVELIELRDRLDAAVTAYASGQIDTTVLGQVDQQVRARQLEVEATIRRSLVPTIEVPTTDVREWWGTLDPMRQRQVVRALIEAIIVKPTVRGRRGRLDENAIEVIWRR